MMLCHSFHVLPLQLIFGIVDILKTERGFAEIVKIAIFAELEFLSISFCIFGLEFKIIKRESCPFQSNKNGNLTRIGSH